MLNVLYKKLNFENVKAIGFDMDGTLYDELDFIQQVYGEINNRLIGDNDILSFMLMRWMTKGSSYPYIFDETFDRIEKKDFLREDFIQNALSIYRNYRPKLQISFRNQLILSHLKKKYDLFLVTDGNYELQQRKYQALQLSNFFLEQNVIFTGQFPMEYQKPDNKVLQLLDINLKNAIFFGDRDKDQLFAESSGMQFQKVYNMIEVEKK